jgi:hypothetical protein
VFVSERSFGGFGSPLCRRLAKNRRRTVASKWPGALKGEENKRNIVAALHVRGGPRAVGPDKKPKTPEDLAAKTAKTTTKPKTEDENLETPINPAAKTAEAGRLGLIVTWSAEFGYVRPA